MSAALPTALDDAMSTALRTLMDIESIRQLKARYCLCVATEDWKTFETLFTEDLRFVTPTDGSTYEPRAAFMAFHKANIQDAKLWGVIRCYTPIIEITGDDSATGIWGMEDLHVWPGNDGPQVGHHGHGHYHEKYVRTADGWRFSEIRVVFQRLDPLEGGFGGRAA